MKFRIAIFCLISAAVFAADVPFTANLKNYSSNPASAYINLLLYSGSAPNQVKSCGPGIIPHVIGSNDKAVDAQPLPPNSDGLVSSSVTPNGDITCGASTGTSYYRIEIREQKGSSPDPLHDRLISYGYYTVGPGAFVLESATPFGGGAIVPSVSVYDTVQDEGVITQQFRTLNFVGSGVTCAPDVPNNATKCTITGSGSPLTTKGDLFGRSAGGDARLAVGADANCLIADSTQALGMRWGSCPGGGVGGSNTQLQFNNSGSAGGITNLTSNGTVTTALTGTNWIFADPITPTKKLQLDLSNITAANTRTLNIPDANSTTAQAISAVAHQFLTGMSAQGLFSQAQPAYSDLTGTPTLPATLANVSHKWLNSYTSGTGLFTQTQPNFSDLTGTGNIPNLAPAADNVIGSTDGSSFANMALLTCGDSGHALAYSTVTHTFTCQSITGSASAGGSNTQVQYNNSSALSGIANMTSDGTNITKLTAGVGPFDFTNATIVKLRVAAGLTTSANGDCGYDSTNNRWHCWQGAADRLMIAATNPGTSGQVCLSNADGSCTMGDPVTSGNQAAATTQTITATGALTGVTVTNIGTVLVTVSGTYAGVAFNFEGTPDGTFTPAFPLNASQLDAASIVSATGALPSNATRSWLVDAAGFTKIRLNATAFTSGTANVTITPVYHQFVPWTNANIASMPAVTGTVTANAGTNLNTSALALDATLTGGSLKGQGNVASAASDAGNPVKVGGVFNTTQPTVTNGQRVDFQTTARGAQIVAPGVDNFPVQINSALPGGSNNIGGVTCTAANCAINNQQVAGTTTSTNTGNADAGTQRVAVASNQPPIQTIPTASATSGLGCTPTHIVSAATTNSNSIKGSAGQLYEVVATNTSSSARWVKFSDSASAPTCGTTAVVQSYIIPGNTPGAEFVIPIPVGMAFANGIGACITGAVADNDTTAIGANEVVLNACYK